jgi:hypothetical protein
MEVFSSKRIASPNKVAPILILALMLATCFATDSVRAQSSPCSGTPPPTETSHPIFKKGANVFVMYDGSLSQTQIDQAKDGFESWNAANVQNGSGIHFQDQNGTADASILITNGTLASSTVSGESFQAGADGYIQTMTIIFNTGAATVSATSNDPYFDPTKLGYDTVFRKNAEHGIGHGMGLSDATLPQTPGDTVMNNAVDNCPNDNCGNEPVAVTPCDSSVVQHEPAYAPSPSPTPVATPPDGNGGCNDCYYYPYNGGGYSYCSYNCTDYYTCASYGDKTECQYQGTDCEVEGCY